MMDTHRSTEEIVEGWIAGVASTGREKQRPDDLVRAYRAVGLMVIRRGMSHAGVDAARDSDADGDREFERAVGRVVSAARRAGLTVSEILEDLHRLDVATMAALRDRAEASMAAEALSVIERVASGLDSAGRQIVRVLEVSALREQREHAKALAAMTAHLSHELSNRLGATRTASQMLVNPDIELDEPRLLRVVEVIEASVTSALRTVDDVLALHQNGTGAEEAVPKASFKRLLRSVASELAPAARQAGVELRLGGETVSCEMDTARVRLILYNLVGNGIKYRARGRTSYVGVRTAYGADGAEIELEVSDNGVGIRATELADIFLYRVRGSEADGVPGSGLGLAIVKEAVEQLGGTIDVASEHGVGTTFTVRLPRPPHAGEAT